MINRRSVPAPTAHACISKINREEENRVKFGVRAP